MPRTRKLTPVELDEIPTTFATEADEDAFWATHDPGPGMLAAATGSHRDTEGPDGGPTPASADRPFRDILAKHTRNLSIRFDLDTISRLRAVAKVKGIGYQTLLKQFVIERLYEEEKRTGLLGQSSASISDALAGQAGPRPSSGSSPRR